MKSFIGNFFFIYDSILFTHTYHLLNFNLIDEDLFDTQIAHPIYEVEEKKINRQNFFNHLLNSAIMKHICLFSNWTANSGNLFFFKN